MELPTVPVDTDDSGGPVPDGTVHNNAWLQDVISKIMAGVNKRLPASTVTGTQNNYAPTGFSTTAGDCTLPWNGAADATFTGFTPGINGQCVLWKNETSSKVAYFNDNDSGSLSGWKFSNIAKSGKTPIAPGGAGLFQYDTTSGTGVWRLCFHEQGAWITPTYAGTDWTASAGTWTVDSGDVIANRYKLSGRTLHFEIAVATTSVSSTPSDLKKLLFGFTSAGVANGNVFLADAGGTQVAGTMSTLTSGTTLQFEKLSGSWSTATNTTAVSAQGFLDVT